MAAKNSRRYKTLVRLGASYETLCHSAGKPNLYQNAMRREKQEKYEMASLLLYRILEIVEQKRLWNYGVDTSDADFTKLCEDEKVLLEKANKIIRSVKGFNEWKQLDKKISLLAGYILLAAVGMI